LSAGTDAQRLLVATIRKCSATDSEHLMVTDHKGRIIYVTSKLAELLGSSAKGLLRTDFSRLMAQPFMQMHSKWMKVRHMPCDDCGALAAVAPAAALIKPLLL
jgi:transcriptional regulator with PAS, ATPase and Fis domain